MTLDEISKEVIPSHLPKLSGNIYCIGRNYGEHVKELKNELPSEPVVFLKAPSSLRTLKPSSLAFQDESFHHEIEIVLLIGKAVPMHSEVSTKAIAGATLGLDLTRRDVQNGLKSKGLPWTTAKSFAGSAIVHTFTNFPDGQAIDFSLSVNGEIRQRGLSSDMIFDFHHILSFLLQYQDLYPGDLVFTGTPAGVAGFRQGDKFHMESKALGISAEGVL